MKGNPRYAIVRADRFCPRALERNYNLKCIGSLQRICKY